MEAKPPVDYSHYIENENAALPATAIHRHAQAGYNTTRSGEKVPILGSGGLFIVKIAHLEIFQQYSYILTTKSCQSKPTNFSLFLE